MGMIFLISSSGYMMYKSNCLCTGEEQTTVFVRPETCGDDFHNHHKHDEADNEIICFADECHDCTEHTKDCGCNSPEFFFFKLQDKALDEDIKFISVQVLEISIASSDLLAELCIKNDDVVTDSYYSEPPTNVVSSLDFLINIQQLKIPSLA